MNLSNVCSFLLVCCLALTAACSRTVPSGGGPAESPAAGANTAKASSDPRGALAESLNSMLAAKSYRAHVVSSSSRGATNVTAEFVAPDRFHLTTDLQMPGQGKTTHETIVVGKDTYVKMGNTPWRKFPVNLGDMISQFRDPKVVAELGKNADVKFIGAETLDGTPTFIYQYTFNLPQNKDFKGTSKTWVGMSDNLPRKTETEGEMNLMGKPVMTKTTITYSDFGSDIKIEPPM